VASLGQASETAQPFDVELGVEPLSAVASCGRDHAVAALPGPQQMGGKSGPEGHRADGVARSLKFVVAHIPKLSLV
jgi:hypothetical protein